MKSFLDSNLLSLLVGYLLLAMLVIWLTAPLPETLRHAIMLCLLALVVLSHEALLRVARSVTGKVSRQQLGVYDLFMALNRELHPLLDINEVIAHVDETLQSRLGIARRYIAVHRGFLQGWEGTVIQDEVHLMPWPAGDSHESPMRSDVEMALRRLDAIETRDSLTQQGGSDDILALMQLTGTSLVMPVKSGGELLCVFLLGRIDAERPWQALELRMFSFLAQQLAIIVDRIRVYQKVVARQEMDHAEKMQIMQSLSANIAHEMRTPLSGIRASLTGVEHYLPALVQGYRQARTMPEGEPLSHIREQTLQALTTSPERINLMIDQANTVIDMLLMNLRHQSLDQLVRCDAGDCVRQAIDRYPFKTGEREKVSLRLEDNFSFMGLDILMIYVLFNLLKNALYSLRSSQKGEITITLENGEGVNSILFRDTGEGMKPEVLQHVFESFFTTREEGTGVGLSFCHRTLHSFGGSIQCHSVYGEFTEFTMQLPALEGAPLTGASEALHSRRSVTQENPGS